MLHALLILFLVHGIAVAGKLPGADYQDDRERRKSDGTTATNVGELRMQKRFGIGVGAAGGLAVIGVEADFHFTEDFSVSGGIGTGLDYTTWAVKAKYYLSGTWVSPYLATGIARWWTDGTSERQVGPSVLRNKFLAPDHDYSRGFSCFIFYPAIGVQFMHKSGFALSLEGQYLFRLFSFANGTYAGAGAHWYF